MPSVPRIISEPIQNTTAMPEIQRNAAKAASDGTKQ